VKAGQAELGVTRRRASAESTVLDWSTGHSESTARPCRHCGGATFLRDDARRASHKVCAERAADRKAVSR
jgi:hypothetical protein